MIANCALLAGLTTFVLALWLAGELAFLAPHRDAIFHQYWRHIVVGLLVAFFNLCGFNYIAARSLFLRETGRKLSHVDRQLTTDDAVLDDLRTRLLS